MQKFIANKSREFDKDLEENETHKVCIKSL